MLELRAEWVGWSIDIVPFLLFFMRLIPGSVSSRRLKPEREPVYACTVSYAVNLIDV